MGRKGITYEQVAAAADALHAEKPGSATLTAIRAVLGTGSPNTIHAHLKLWNENRPKVTAQPIAIPDDVARALNGWVLQASTGARADSEERALQAQADADELARVGEDLEAERDRLLAEISTLTTQRDQEQATASERAAEIQRLVSDVERERALAGVAQVEAAQAKLTAESQLEQLADMRDRIEKLSASVEKERDARIAAEREAAVVAAKLAGAVSEFATARDQMKALQEDLAVIRERAEQARSTADARAQQDQMRIDQMRQDYEVRLDEHRRVIEHTRGQLASVTVDNAHLQERLTLLASGSKE